MLAAQEVALAQVVMSEQGSTHVAVPPVASQTSLPAAQLVSVLT